MRWLLLHNIIGQHNNNVKIYWKNFLMQHFVSIRISKSYNSFHIRPIPDDVDLPILLERAEDNSIIQGNINISFMKQVPTSRRFHHTILYQSHTVECWCLVSTTDLPIIPSIHQQYMMLKDTLPHWKIL